MKCSKCWVSNPEEAQYCHQCGSPLAPVRLPDKKITSERKHVSVLFSDVSGYTSMSEILDPEEVTEIMSRIFKEATRVVTELEGSIDQFIGDSILAVFGALQTHEDDAVRAIIAAQRIHRIVEAISPEIEGRIGRPLAMHSGINSGLIVTGEMDLKAGKGGITGDTINLASRLEGLSEAGEILVGPQTYQESFRHFTFEDLGPQRIKGKSSSLHVFKVLTQREHPEFVAYSSGVRAGFIGRREEIRGLCEALEQVKKGTPAVVTIVGNAGTGKTRLVEEFRNRAAHEDVQWLEGYSYAHRQRISYGPVIDCLTHSFSIEENDSPRVIRLKLESGLKSILSDYRQTLPYIGSLFSLSYPEIEEVSPEFWKGQLQHSIETTLSGFAGVQRTILCLEDLHWADPSSIELLHYLLNTISRPLLFICLHRPEFALFDEEKHDASPIPHFPIQLHDFASSESTDLVHSLLEAEHVPAELVRAVDEKAGGNPFYIEEVINTLLDDGILIRQDHDWKLTTSLHDADIPSSINGLLTARLDKLDRGVKRIIQEASVIGRKFLLIVLTRISIGVDNISHLLENLQQLDLIRLHQTQPELEYIFKHAITQEVAYNGLLKKERSEIHQRIGHTIEQLFESRLSEFYEELAYHFRQGKSEINTLKYLIKSGEKNLKRYSLVESDNYFRDAYEILNDKHSLSDQEKVVLLDLLMRWALVFYYKGDFKGLTEMLTAHESTAQTVDDSSMLGMYYAWLGFSLYSHGRLMAADELLTRALNIGETTRDEKVIGYACTWLSFLRGDFGQLGEARKYAYRALSIAQSIESDQYLFFKPLGGIIQVCYYSGDIEKARNSAQSCLEIGEKYSNVRAATLGHIGITISHFLRGEFNESIASARRAITISADPLYQQIANMLLGLCHIQKEEFDQAAEIFERVIEFSEAHGCEWSETPAKLFMGVTLISTGKMSQGMKMIEKARAVFNDNNKKPYLATVEYILGRIYLQMVAGNQSIGPSVVLKNIFFLLKNLPVAARRAEHHLLKAADMATAIGAKGILGQIYLDLGLLYKKKQRKEQARSKISLAISFFDSGKAPYYLDQAHEALLGLE